MRIRYRLDDLRALLALKESPSFLRAAQRLNITQSAFSRRIAQLEDAVGARLVERTSRRVALSPLGLSLVEEAGVWLPKLDRSLEDAVLQARGDAGRVRLACLTTVACSRLPAVLGQFRQSFPQVRLEVHDDTGQRVTQSVLAREAEFGVSVVEEGHDSLHTQSVAKDPFVLALAPDHPLARRQRMRWDELAPWKPVSLGSSSANRKRMDAELAMVGMEPPWFDEVDHLSTMIGFLRHGGAIGVLPRLALDAGAHDLTVRPLVSPVIHREIGLIRRKETELSRPGQWLWQLLARSLTS